MTRLRLTTLFTLLAVLVAGVAATGAAAKPKSKLKPPAKVKVTRTTATTATLSWKDKSSERYFEASAKPGKNVVKTKKNETTATLAGLAPGKTYKFSVRACKSGKSCSKFSKKRKAKTNSIPGNAPPFGFNEQLTPGGTGNALLKGSGASFIRVPVAWPQIQPIAPPLGLPLPPPLPLQLNWAPMDALKAELAKQGLKPLWVISGAPCWAQGKGSGCPEELAQAPAPAFYDDYANFVTRVALRYPDSVGVQVWNEPNIPKFWAPKPNAANYRSLLRQTAKMASDFGAQAPIVYGAPSPVDADDARKMPEKIPTTSFLKATLQGGVQGLDAVAVHPYSFNEPGDGIKNSIRLYDQAAAILKSTVPALPVWVTEIGFTTAGDFRVTPEQQAASLSAVYETLVQRGVKLISVHRFFDDANPPFKFEGGMGVIESNRKTIKPAYCSLAALRGSTPAVCGR